MKKTFDMCLNCSIFLQIIINFLACLPPFLFYLKSYVASVWSSTFSPLTLNSFNNSLSIVWVLTFIFYNFFHVDSIFTFISNPAGNNNKILVIDSGVCDIPNGFRGQTLFQFTCFHPVAPHTHTLSLNLFMTPFIKHLAYTIIWQTKRHNKLDLFLFQLFTF